MNKMDKKNAKLVEEAKKQSTIEHVKDLVKRAKKDYLGLSDGEQEFLSVLSQIIWDMNRIKTQERERIVGLFEVELKDKIGWHAELMAFKRVLKVLKEGKKQ